MQKIGRWFVVRDLPWTEDKLRAIAPFEFENWTVIALGGIPNKTQVGDWGINGRAVAIPNDCRASVSDAETVSSCNVWPFDTNGLQIHEGYPMQFEQMDKADRPDIDTFESMMAREILDEQIAHKLV